MVSNMFSHPCGLTICILLVILAILATVYYQMFKKINIKILYATIALAFGINLLIDGVVMRGIRQGSSARPFAEQVQKEYPLDDTNMYVVNDLKTYSNLYGLNFYLGNKFHNFDQEQPVSGFFFCTAKDLEKIQKNYGDKYTFSLLTSTKNVIADVRQRIVLCSFLQNE